MYFNLYKLSNLNENRSDVIPHIDFNEELLKANSVDFPEVYICVEMMAIISVRTHFFNWVENCLVAPAI